VYEISARWTTVALGILLSALVAGCGSEPGPTAAAPVLPEHDAAAPAVPAVDAGQPEAVVDAAPSDPPCTKGPCASRPIIFIHGFRGSNDDWFSMLGGLVASDARYDGFRLAGTKDHAAWPARSIDRRSWLFSFDYYNSAKEDLRDAYTAGPGRIGSNASYACNAPSGAGHIVADDATYSAGVTHDYAEDLARMVDDVLRATGAEEVDFVAHSMGGMVVRSYLSFHGGAKKTNRVLLLASPVEGVALIGFLNYIGLGQPDWMNAHEIAELDAGSLLTKTHFSRCDDGIDAGAFGSKLLAEEKLARPAKELYVMSGQKDLAISYATADHPLAATHEVVPGVDHSGILKSAISVAKVRSFLGGLY
jgi:pimeloyl-ACP methyl ester carboxylesterase